MGQYRKLKEYTKNKLNQYRKHDAEFYGRIGDLSSASNKVYVPGKSYTIYVTLQNGTVVQAINNRVPSYFNMPVIVGYVADDRPNIMQVLRKWTAYGSVETPADGVPFHHAQHEWPNADTLYSAGEQLRPAMYYPSALNVQIWPGTFYTSSGWKTVSALTVIDMTASIPGSAGYARYSVIAVDSSGAFVVRDGTAISGYDNLADTNIPTYVQGDTPICAVKLYNGQTAIRMDNNNNDFVDLRWSRIYTTGIPALTVKSATYTLTAADYTVIFTATATANLPAATGSGRTYRIVNASGAGTVTIDGNGADTVRGTATITLTAGQDATITDYVATAWA